LFRSFNGSFTKSLSEVAIEEEFGKRLVPQKIEEL
jgi:hypothetical protein